MKFWDRLKFIFTLILVTGSIVVIIAGAISLVWGVDDNSRRARKNKAIEKMDAEYYEWHAKEYPKSRESEDPVSNKIQRSEEEPAEVPESALSPQETKPLEPDAIAAKLKPSVATLVLSNGKQGTGFALKSNGWLVTNHHVVDGTKSGSAMIDGISLKIEDILLSDKKGTWL